MPTERQLDIMMQSDLEFGCQTNDIQSHGSFYNDNKSAYDKPFTGKQCGYLVYDKENDDIKIVFDKKES